MADKPKVNSSSDKEMQKMEKQFDAYDQQIKDLTLDRMNEAQKVETEQQTKISQKDIEKSKDIYIKPSRSIRSPEKFNEKYRSDYEFAKEYVHIIAENKEIIGESLEFWTKPFAGIPAEFWQVPVNKPLWVPRYVAERIKGCSYHRFEMAQNQSTGTDGMGTYFGSMVVDRTINRLDAHPVSERKSIFMGAKSF